MNSSSREVHLDPYFEANLPQRNRKASAWRTVFQISTTIGMIALALLLYTIVNEIFGMLAIDNKVDPASLAVNGHTH